MSQEKPTLMIDLTEWRLTLCAKQWCDIKKGLSKASFSLTTKPPLQPRITKLQDISTHQFWAIPCLI